MVKLGQYNLTKWDFSSKKVHYSPSPPKQSINDKYQHKSLFEENYIYLVMLLMLPRFYI